MGMKTPQQRESTIVGKANRSSNVAVREARRPTFLKLGPRYLKMAGGGTPTSPAPGQSNCLKPNE